MSTRLKVLSTSVKASSFHFHIMEYYAYGIHNLSSGKLYYTDVMEMLRDIDPPLGFGKDCPERQAYKRLIRMNMPMDQEGKVIIY